MKRWIPIGIVAAILAIVGVIAVQYVQQHQAATPDHATKPKHVRVFHRPIYPQQRCAGVPKFLASLGIRRPIIDLSQQHAKGVLLWYGRGFTQRYHPKAWERYGPMGTFTLDRAGNIYTAPNPFVSIEKETFAQQRRLYRIDGETGTLGIWKTFDDVHPSGQNPYGVVSVVYDCTDDTLWVAAIDESDFHAERGVIYHVDTQDKHVIERIEGIDALTLALGQSENGRVLLVGSARNPSIEAIAISTNNPVRYLVTHFNEPSLRARKIKIRPNGDLYVEAIPFRYNLVVQSSDRQRTPLSVRFDNGRYVEIPASPKP